MPTPRALNKEKRNDGTLGPFQDAERMGQLILQEAKTSLPKAGRIIGKLIVVEIFGFVLASNCCLLGYLVPVGVIALAIGACWLDAIGKECSCHRFFPQKSLNIAGGYLLRWQWVVIWACILFTLSSTGTLNILQSTLRDRVWKVSIMAVVPLALMLLGRAVQPYQFWRARADVQKAELIVRQLVATQKASAINALAPLIESDRIPLYKLGSVAKLLYTFAVSYDATDKATVELAQQCQPTHENRFKRFLSMAYSPFRAIASDLLLWESRDLVLYIVIAVYVALVYLGWYYFPWTPLCVLVPFMGPRSRTKLCSSPSRKYPFGAGSFRREKGWHDTHRHSTRVLAFSELAYAGVY